MHRQTRIVWGAALLSLSALAGWPAAAASAAGSASHDACAYLLRTITPQRGDAVFLASYPTAAPGPLQHVAFLYDNALATIALLACGQPQQARRIGDAMLLALAHDRFWHDGRLRNGYAAGSVDGSVLKLSGWWDGQAGRWLEDSYQVGSDAGNMAWAMLALVMLDDDARAGADAYDGRYGHGAQTLGRWLDGLRDTRGAGGFTGGSFGSDAAPQRQLWKSTEHNVDLAAAFARLAASTGDVRWQSRSQIAAHFVESMWDPLHASFAAGTAEDGVTVNALQALDAQIWPLLALPHAMPHFAPVLPSVETHLRAGEGYGYSEAGGGPWTEGTAQMLLLLQLLHRESSLRAPRAALAAARTPGGGYYATTVAALPTGFQLDTDPGQPRLYLHLEHLGAAAWVALAQQGFNPFTGERALPP